MTNSVKAQDKIQNINFLFANNGYGFGYEYEKFQKSIFTPNVYVSSFEYGHWTS